MRLTFEGIVVAVAVPFLLLLGLVLAVPVLVALALAFGAALVVASAIVGRRPRLSVQRRLEVRRGVVGEPARAMLLVTNLGSRPNPAATIQEPVGDDFRNLILAVPTLAAGASDEQTYDLPTDRRGVLVLGPARVRRDDPFGLVTWSQELSGSEKFWVHPRTLRLPALPSGRRRDLEGPASNAAMQGTAQFHSLREFVRGDDRRHIHWRSSLRTGTIMVAEHVDVTRPKTTVVLDVQTDHWDDDSFERGVSIAASVLVSTIERGFPVRLLATDGTSYEEEQRPDVNLVLDVCSGLSRRDEAPLATAATWLARDRSGSTLTIITGSDDPMVVAPLRPLASRYDEVVVIRVAATDKPEPEPGDVGARGQNAGSDGRTRRRSPEPEPTGARGGTLVVHDVRDVRTAWLQRGRR